MSLECIFAPGNWFYRTTLSIENDNVPEIKISADPHDYQKSFCMKIRYDRSGKYDGDWLLGNSYLKFRIYLDGKLVGCGPFRCLVNSKRMEHTFAFPNISKGKHTLAIIGRCDNQGLSITPINCTLGKWKIHCANDIYSPICWEFPAVYGYFKGDCGPGEYFEHIRGDLIDDNWMSFEFDDSTWQDAPIHQVDADVETAPFDFEHEEVKPLSIYKTSDGRFIVDFGVERIASLQLKGSVKGGNTEVRLAEELFDQDHIMFQMNSHVCCQEIWKYKPGKQVLSHFGLRAFRYAEIVNYSDELTIDDITMLVVRAPYKRASVLTCNNKNISDVWQLCENTIKNITCDTFVDCFTRERVAYEADALLTIGSFFVFNQNSVIARRHLPYQLNHPTWPCEWSLIIPLLFYEYYWETADKSVIAENFEKLVAYSSYKDSIKDGMIESFMLEVLVDWPRAYRDRYDTGDKKYLSVPNMLACKVIGVLAYLAKEINKDDLAQEFTSLHQQMVKALNEKCFDPVTGLYIDRPGSKSSSLYANMWALYADIVPEERQQKVADFVAGFSMDCSLYSGYYYLDVLFRYGHAKEAFELIAKDDSRWQEMLKAGCSVTPEYWIGDVAMMSMAHPWGAYPVHFISKYVFGMRPLTPGWKTYEIAPNKTLNFSGELRMVRNGVNLVSVC